MLHRQHRLAPQKHLCDRELQESSVTEESSVTAADGKKYRTRLYSLEAIIAVGYRVQSARATQFRTWATNRLKDYILKGFAIDSERFKHGSRFDRQYFEQLLEEVREIRASERMVYQKITDIYATAADYSPNTSAAEKFFATVQNKLHFATTGQTAAEIIAGRASARHPTMGLTTWRKAPKGKILKTDITIAKNYLRPAEMKSLNHIVDMYLDYAEFQASRGRLMKMQDWAQKLDAFLQFNEQEILHDKGRVSHSVAVALAEKEYRVSASSRTVVMNPTSTACSSSFPNPSPRPKNSSMILSLLQTCLNPCPSGAGIIFDFPSPVSHRAFVVRCSLIASNSLTFPRSSALSAVRWGERKGKVIHRELIR